MHNRIKSCAFLALASLISACGGGLGGAFPPLPEGLTISLPAESDTAAVVSLASNASAEVAYQYSWDFGDGQTSNDAKPRHQYAKAGEYLVHLRLGNGSGDSREASAMLTVNNLSAVRGLKCTGPAFSAWCWQQGYVPNPETVNDIAYLDAKTYIFVGKSGLIAKTSDAGLSWERQQSGLAVDLLGIRSLDAMTAWVWGRGNLLLYTHDGGEHWNPVQALSVSGRVVSIDSVTPIAPDSVELLVHVDGFPDARQLLTEDAGKTWKQSRNGAPLQRAPDGTYWNVNGSVVSRSSQMGAELQPVLQALDANGKAVKNGVLSFLSDKVLMFNTVTGRPQLWRSEDGGLHWSSVPATDLPSGYVKLLPGDLGGRSLLAYSGSDNWLYRTDDGGRSWKKEHTPWVGPSGLCHCEDYPNLLQVGAKLLAISSRRGYFGLSEDFGRSWRAVELHGNEDANWTPRLQWLSNDALVELDRWEAYFSSDKGGTWHRVWTVNELPEGRVMFSSFLNARLGFQLDDSGRLSQSTDGGRTWQLSSTRFERGGPEPMGLQFVNEQSGFLLRAGELYRSEDGGVRWAKWAARRHWIDFRFADAKNGWALAAEGIGGFALSRDGAKTWKPLTGLAQALSLHVDAGATLTAVGRDGFVAQSSDEGASWVLRDSGVKQDLGRIYSLDGAVYWALGTDGLLLKSEDAGKTWSRRKVPTSSRLNDVQFTDARHGWIVGDDGVVLASRDGGKTWSRQASGTAERLRSVQFVDARTGWVIGDNGALLATGTGGN